jgi:hypothetical protein
MNTWNDGSTNLWLLVNYKEKAKRESHVNTLELLEIVAVVWTFGPAFFCDQQVLFFCDSTTVMSMTAHGCARDPHLATLSNTMHLSVARLRCQAWFEWVPSDANPDDIPSRPQGGAADFYEKEHLKQWQYAMCFPSMAQLRNPLFHDIRS